jgi:hypothetical protein
MKIKRVIYLSLAVGLLIFAVPQLEMGQGWTLPTVFGIVWIGMMLLIIAAQLYQWIGVDEETKEEFARIKKYKRWKTEQFITGKVKMMQARK